MDTADRIVTTLEYTAEQSDDITQACYERFYAACPPARQLMQHVDPLMQGRMLQEVLELLLTPLAALNERLVQFEVRNHTGYGVAPDQYRPLFEAVRDTVRDTLGEAWTDADARAWQDRIDGLMALVDSSWQDQRQSALR